LLQRQIRHSVGEIHWVTGSANDFQVAYALANANRYSMRKNNPYKGNLLKLPTMTLAQEITVTRKNDAIKGATTIQKIVVRPATTIVFLNRDHIDAP
jgi:hypothetical protein